MLSSFQLKLTAMLAMTVDHIGLILFPDITIFRIIGRISFPIFAYMIAEGCRYTRNIYRYFACVFAVGAVCQTVEFAVSGSLYQCVMITFSLSIFIISVLKRTYDEKCSIFLPILALTAVFALCELVPALLKSSNFGIDYGFIGVMLPVIIYMASSDKLRLFSAAVGTAALSLSIGGLEWYSLAAIPVLALYNGERGRRPMKRLFYIYYPLHISALYLIKFITA